MRHGNHPPLTTVVDLLMDAICVVDPEGRFLYLSAACERIFGYRADELLGRPMIELVAPEDRERTLQAASSIMHGEPLLNFENRYRRKDGRYADIQWSARWSESDGVRIAVARDISVRKRAERLQMALYAISEAAHAAGDLPALFGRIRQIIGELLAVEVLYVALGDEPDDAGTEEGGRTLNVRLRFAYPAEVAGAPPRAVADLCARVVSSEQALLQSDPGGVCWLGVPLNSLQGVIGALLLGSPRDGAGYGEQELELLQFVSAQVAIAIERKRLYARLEHAARYDALTGLANRALLLERMRGALARARRSGRRLALLYLDLDGFKQVNDRLGHAAGDLLLQEVARRLRQSVRETDTVARLGGDEFVVLLEGIRRRGKVRLVVEKIRAVLGQPVEPLGEGVSIAASIGVALYPEGGATPAELLEQADAAMYAAKLGDLSRGSGSPEAAQVVEG